MNDDYELLDNDIEELDDSSIPNLTTQKSISRKNIPNYQSYYRKKVDLTKQIPKNNGSMNKLKNNYLSKKIITNGNTGNNNDYNNNQQNDEQNSNTSSLNDKNQSISQNNNNSNKTKNILNGFLSKGKSNSKNLISLFGNGKGNGKLNLLKIKIFLGIGGVVFILFIFIFIIVFLDSAMNNFLNILNWNFGSSDPIDSDVDYSHDDTETKINDSLVTIIGEDGIKSLTDKINNSGENCTGTGIATKVLTLIDELNSHNFRIPYGGKNDDSLIVNPNWGKDSDGGIHGFYDETLINWALNAGNVKNVANKLSDYKNLAEKIDIEYGNPGDIIIYGAKVYMILQNTGSSITAAYVTGGGLTYKKFTLDALKPYDVYNMNLYYSSNCNN